MYYVVIVDIDGFKVASFYNLNWSEAVRLCMDLNRPGKLDFGNTAKVFCDDSESEYFNGKMVVRGCMMY